MVPPHATLGEGSKRGEIAFWSFVQGEMFLYLEEAVSKGNVRKLAFNTCRRGESRVWTEREEEKMHANTGKLL